MAQCLAVTYYSDISLWLGMSAPSEGCFSLLLINNGFIFIVDYLMGSSFLYLIFKKFYNINMKSFKIRSNSYRLGGSPDSLRAKRFLRSRGFDVFADERLSIHHSLHQSFTILQRNLVHSQHNIRVPFPTRSGKRQFLGALIPLWHCIWIPYLFFLFTFRLIQIPYWI